MKMKLDLGKFENWRLRHLSDKNFMLILSIIVGLAVGLAAVIIKNCVHYIKIFADFIANTYTIYLYILFPSIGIFATIIFVKFINRKKVEHGIPSVLYSISKNNGIIHRHNLFSSIITSALTVGFGGSVGLEGPTVATGAAIGSNIGRVLKLNYRQIILLLGCACAGAMAAIFKAPITAVVFALEVIMLDLTMASIVPLLLSSSTAALTSFFFMGQNVLYSVEKTDPLVLKHMPYFILLGIITGLISVYFTRTYKRITRSFEKIKRNYTKWIIGSITLGILILLLPSLYGEGYEVINKCLNADDSYLFNGSFYESISDNFTVIVFLFFGIILFKGIAASITFSSGGVGGIFAPTLFLGANTGLLFAKIANQIGINISQTNFALVGMAGMISGVIHAPLTSVFLIAEITNGYSLILPLMVTAAISYATIKLFEPNSVYTFQLAERGELMTHDKDKRVLMLMKIDKLIEKDFITIHPDNTLGDLVKVVARSKRNVFPVIDKENNMVGVLTLNDIRNIMFETEQYDTIYVRNIMYFPEHYVSYFNTIEEIAEIIESSGRYNVPVLKNGKYMGFLSRAKVFSSYRQLLKEFSED